MTTDALINVNGNHVQALEIIFLTTLIALLPSMLVMMTCFTRFIIVISFLRTAMGTQQAPPNMVLVGIALILTLFVMTPTIKEIEITAYDPYVNEDISQAEFVERAVVPLKKFMITQIVAQKAEATVAMYCDMAGETMAVTPQGMEDLPLTVIIPAFITNELKVAFELGFLIYIPFLLVDMVIASTLMSMGMMMLPPSLISLPFKLLLFIFLDGWNQVFMALVTNIY